MPRPITHNLMVSLLEELGVELKEIRIEKLVDETFYAVLSLQQKDGVRELDCRPSDAMCLAVRTGSPIYVADDVLDAVGKEKGDLLEMGKDREAIKLDGTGIDAIAAAIEEKTGKPQTIHLPRDRDR